MRLLELLTPKISRLERSREFIGVRQQRADFNQIED